jgi:predicted nucleotidyltransferase
MKKIRSTARKIGKNNSNVRKIILFGSIEERRGVPGSDADILIILEKDARPLINRTVEWVERFSLDFPLEVFPYTKKELHHTIVQTALEKGIVLYER